jgi:phytoene dehydrogenase-like protein
MLPALLRIMPLGAQSVMAYAARFKHPAIRLLLTSVVNPNYDAVALLATLGCFASGDGGYIIGGALTLVANMAKCFEDLGGVIHYGKKADHVLVKNGKAWGAVIEGETIPADAVIVSSDALTAIDTLFVPPIREGWARTMRAKTCRPGALVMCSFVSIGVETDLSNHPESTTFPLENSFEYAGRQISRLAYKLYSDSAGYAPDGCSAITLTISGDSYDYWKQAREQGRYDERKKELFEQILAGLEKHLPAIKGKVAVWDVATPLTYERYCGTYHGSWMTLTPAGSMRVSYPSKPKRIRNCYFAGQRIMPPGGTPVAVSTGRTAAQYLCRDFGAVFVT